MNKYLTLIVAFFAFSIVNAQSYLDIENKDIVIPPYDNKKYSYYSYVNCVYSEPAIGKRKFKEEYLYPTNIWGERIHVDKVEIINKGKKNECILIIASHQGNTIGIHIPLKFNTRERPYSSQWFLKITEDPGFAVVYGIGRLDELKIPYIDMAIVDSLNSAYQNKIVYPYKEAYPIRLTRKDFGSYRNFPNDYLLLGKPYEFLGIHLDKKGFYTLSTSPTVHLKDSKGNIIRFPIRSNTIESSTNHVVLSNYHSAPTPSPSIETFNEFFKEEGALMIESEARLSTDSTTILKEKFLGKEIYFSYDKSSYATFSDEPTIGLDKNDKFVSYGVKPNGFFNFERIELRPSDTHRPYMLYYAILANDKSKIAVPIMNGFSNHIILGDEKRENDRQEQLASERKELERQKLIEQEERAAHNAFVRKFGASNARLIENGEIRLGFSRAMVEEAWGTPSDITTIINQLGTVECWIYGYSTFVYFRSGKVVQIIN